MGWELARGQVSNVAALGGFDPATVALAARFSTPPTTARTILINNLIVALKTGGVWPLLDALYMPGADANAFQQNWVQNNYNLTVTLAPTFVADRGYTTNGVSNFVDTNFNPTTATTPLFSLNSATFGIWVGGANAQYAGSIAGWNDGTNATIINPRTTTDLLDCRINESLAGSTSGANTNSVGLMLVTRGTSTSVAIYANAVNINNSADVSTARVNATFRWGNAATASFRAASFYGGVIGSSLSAGQNTTLYNAMLAYNQAVGAA